MPTEQQSASGRLEVKETQRQIHCEGLGTQKNQLIE